jgi:AraC-like DNA-binding protein
MVRTRTNALQSNGRTWSTAVVPEQEQFGFWQELVCQAFVPVSLSRRAEGSFVSSVTGRDVGPLAISRIVSPPQSVTRTDAQLKRQAGDVYFLNMPLSRGSSATQDGRVAELAPGDFAIVDSTRPFELSFEQSFEQISLAVPHDLLGPLLASPEDATGVRVRASSGAGAVASGALRALAGTGAIDRETSGQLAKQVVGLIALALSGTSNEPHAKAPELLLRAAFAEAHRSLGNPELSPTLIAERIGVSTRYLHELFSRRGPSFGRWVLERRLERCEHDLGDPERTHWTIAQIALQNGFSDPSYFARAYRQRYGSSPRERRARALRDRRRRLDSAVSDTCGAR